MDGRHVRSVLGIILVAIAVTVLIGWAGAVEAFKSVVPGHSTMKVNTAICFLLVGVAFLLGDLSSLTWRHVGAASGALVLVIGLLTMIEYISGRDLGIDQLFIRDEGVLTGSGFPGRMSPLTASAWIALGPAIMLLTLGTARRTIIVAHLLVAYASFVAFLAAAGYAFGAEAFWGIGFYTAMAIHTAVGLLISVAGLLITRADEGWLAPYKDSPDARAMLAWLLPVSIGVPIALGFLLLFGSGVGAYNAAFGFALFVPSTALALVAVALRVAGRARDDELALRTNEIALRESEARLSNALAIAKIGTFELPVQVASAVLDQRSREILGFELERDVDAETFFERVHPADRQRVLAEFRACRDTMSRMETEFRIRWSDGTDKAIAVYCDVRGGGNAERVVGVMGDISERKQLEDDLRTLNETLEQRVRERSMELERVHEQLRQSQKLEAMGQLTGGVAHDFNNLLSPIIGSLDLIQRKGFDDPRVQRLVEGALASAERAKLLVQRLLAFARRQPLQPSAVDIASLLDGMTELIASTSGPRIRLVVNVEKELPAAIADSNQLEMALLNLAVNARDAMPDGGVLTINAVPGRVEAGSDSRVPPGHYIRLSVADTGTGMDETTLARAVEPFFSTKGVGRGTGLGLSMVHGLAAQLGGGLQMQSEPGVGTVVELLLPVANASGETLGRLKGEDIIVGSGQALLVDDEEMVRATTAEMLAGLGFDVVESHSADNAKDLIRQGLSPELVVTDHLMPGMTGTDFARWVKDHHPGMPVLIISGYAEVDDVASDLPHLAKPFRQDDLANALTAIMIRANKASRRKNVQQ